MKKQLVLLALVMGAASLLLVFSAVWLGQEVAAQGSGGVNIIAAPFAFNGERSLYEIVVEPYQVITIGVSVLNTSVDDTNIIVKIPFWYHNLQFLRWGNTEGMVGSWHNWGEYTIFEGYVICHSPLPRCHNGYGWEEAWLEFMVYDDQASFITIVQEEDYPEWELRPVTVTVKHPLTPRVFLPIVIR